MDMPANGSDSLRDELQDNAEKIADLAKDRLQSGITDQKGGAVAQAKNVSSALGGAAEGLGSDSPAWLKSAMQQAAGAIQRLAESVDQKDTGQLTRDVQRLARDNPGTFLAGCALAGFAAARVLQVGMAATVKQGTDAKPQPSMSGPETNRPAMSFANQSANGGDEFVLPAGVAT